MDYLVFFRNIVKFIFCVILVLCGWLSGSSHEKTKQLQKELTESNAQLNKTIVQSNQTQGTVTKYFDKTEEIKNSTKVIIKKVPIYVTEQNDRDCTIPDSFRLHWNATNQGVLPDDIPAGDINAPPSNVKLSDVAAQHTTEAELCRQTEAQLISLQEWVKNSIK